MIRLILLILGGCVQKMKIVPFGRQLALFSGVLVLAFQAPKGMPDIISPLQVMAKDPENFARGLKNSYNKKPDAQFEEAEKMIDNYF